LWGATTFIKPGGEIGGGGSNGGGNGGGGDAVVVVSVVIFCFLFTLNHNFIEVFTFRL